LNDVAATVADRSAHRAGRLASHEAAAVRIGRRIADRRRRVLRLAVPIDVAVAVVMTATPERHDRCDEESSGRLDVHL
jgi:hypothetical protein